MSIGTIPEEVIFNYDPWEYEKGNTTIDHYKEAYDWLLSEEENFDVSENDYYVILSKYGCILKDAQSYALKCEKNGFIPTRFRETPGTDENDTGEYYYWNPYNGKYIRINYCKDESGNNLLQICLMKVALNTPPSESE